MANLYNNFVCSSASEQERRSRRMQMIDIEKYEKGFVREIFGNSLALEKLIEPKYKTVAGFFDYINKVCAIKA